MILVTGANGMLGSYIDGPDYYLTDIYNLDVTKKQNPSKHKKISCIIHLAAETNLEFCEKNPNNAYKVNTLGTYNMTCLAVDLGVPILYISTAGVFDGTKRTPYVETDKPSPINDYGTTKWYGEAVVESYPKHWILRAGWMMGGVEKDKKFVGKIMNKIRSGEKEIYAINDVLGSPTYAKDLSKVIKNIDKLPYGLYHSCGSGKATRYDVACEIVKSLGYKVKVYPISTKGYSEKDYKHSTMRSANEMMSISKLQKHGLNMRNWKIALKEYLKEWKDK